MKPPATTHSLLQADLAAVLLGPRVMHSVMSLRAWTDDVAAVEGLGSMVV